MSKFWGNVREILYDFYVTEILNPPRNAYSSSVMVKEDCTCSIKHFDNEGKEIVHSKSIEKLPDECTILDFDGINFDDEDE